MENAAERSAAFLWVLPGVGPVTTETPGMSIRVGLAIGVGCLFLLGLLVWKIRQRYRAGRRALEELQQQARSMNMETQAMAQSADAVTTRKKS